tara:strand:- start:977 stop:1105 length:129 start_codon:yes stop_codon:yes gene_type:complete
MLLGQYFVLPFLLLVFVATFGRYLCDVGEARQKKEYQSILIG